MNTPTTGTEVSVFVSPEDLSTPGSLVAAGTYLRHVTPDEYNASADPIEVVIASILGITSTNAIVSMTREDGSTAYCLVVDLQRDIVTIDEEGMYTNHAYGLIREVPREEALA